jgi:hypothetical protein
MYVLLVSTHCIVQLARPPPKIMGWRVRLGVQDQLGVCCNLPIIILIINELVAQLAPLGVSNKKFQVSNPPSPNYRIFKIKEFLWVSLF